MAITDPNMIKKIVRNNFNKSSVQYDRFENKFGLFEYLTYDLAKICYVNRDMVICDVGCGSGTSSFVLGNLVGDSGKVVGIDFSDEMLVIAKRKAKMNIEFIKSDALSIREIIDYQFDRVLFNACIFLIPDPEKTLESTFDILKVHGIVGMNYLTGIYPVAHLESTDCPEMFEFAKKNKQSFAPYGRGINDVSTFGAIMKDIGFSDIKEGIISKEMSLEEVKAFYSIPAQSAALWPKNDYNERLELLEQLFQYLITNDFTEFHQYWGWCKGVKKR